MFASTGSIAGWPGQQDQPEIWLWALGAFMELAYLHHWIVTWGSSFGPALPLPLMCVCLCICVSVHLGRGAALLWRTPKADIWPCPIKLGSLEQEASKRTANDWPWWEINSLSPCDLHTGAEGREGRPSTSQYRKVGAGHTGLWDAFSVLARPVVLLPILCGALA